MAEARCPDCNDERPVLAGRCAVCGLRLPGAAPREEAARLRPPLPVSWSLYGITALWALFLGGPDPARREALGLLGLLGLALTALYVTAPLLVRVFAATDLGGGRRQTLTAAQVRAQTTVLRWLAAGVFDVALLAFALRHGCV